MHRQMGDFSSVFFTFTSTLVVILSGLHSTGLFQILGWQCYNPLQDLIGVSFSIVGWWDFKS